MATEAGLSVPYVENLESGRGNPTVDAVRRLADALGATFVLRLEPESGTRARAAPSLVRLSRGARFRQDVRTIAEATGEQPAELAGRLLDAVLLVHLRPVRQSRRKT